MGGRRKEGEGGGWEEGREEGRRRVSELANQSRIDFLDLTFLEMLET